MVRQCLALESGLQSAPGSGERVSELVREHVAFVWRCLRRMGLCEGEADDAVQLVFLTAARKLDALAPGRERAFLFATALRIAASTRRRIERRREELTAELDHLVVDTAPDPEALLEHRRARQVLDTVLCALSLEHRAVLMLAEMEQLTVSEIAEVLELKVGTVASRLRRARAAFNRRLARIEASLRFTGESP